MAWSIEKVPTRVERQRRFPYVQMVRYEWSCFFSAHGAATGTAATRKQAENLLVHAQNSLWAP